MLYPLMTFIEYLFGSKIAATKLLSSINPKRLIKYHFFNILISLIFTFLLSNFLLDRIKLDESYELLSQYVSFSTTSIFLAYLPLIIFSYLFLAVVFSFLALIYQGISKAFNSTVTLKTTFYSLQFLSILHPLSYMLMYLLLVSTTIGLMDVMLALIYILALILFFTISKQYAQIAGVTTITIFLLNLIIGGLIIIITKIALGNII